MIRTEGCKVIAYLKELQRQHKGKCFGKASSQLCLPYLNNPFLSQEGSKYQQIFRVEGCPGVLSNRELFQHLNVNVEDDFPFPNKRKCKGRLNTVGLGILS
jgi:hypothetical protein